MNLFNKTIAGFTAIALTVSGILPVANVAQAAGWEQNAFDRNADLMPKITNASNVAALQKMASREEAVAFLSRFTENYDLGLDFDATANCDYTDMGNIMSDLTDEVMAACEAGITKSADTNLMFNPTSLVTEGQFATMIARMVSGDPTMEIADANAYLSDIDVMGEYAYTSYKGDKSLSKILALEMLRKVALALEQPMPVDCVTDPTLPECLPGTTGTMNTGTVVEVKAGTLDVSLNASSPANLSSIPMQGIVKFATVNFTAGSNDVSLNEVSLKRSGLGNNVDVNKVYFEKDGIRVSGRSSVASDGVVVLNFNPAFVVKAWSTESIDLYAELAGTLAWSEHKFSSTAIVSSALTTNGSIETPTLRTANYTVASVGFASAGAGGSSTADQATDLELGQFRLTNNGNGTSETRDVLLKGVTLRNDGTASVQDSVKSLGLYRNGMKVSTTAIMNGKEITFWLVGDEIKDSQSATYYIRGNVDYVDAVGGDTYKFSLKRNSDLNTVEKTTAFRTSVTPTTAVTLAQYTVNGADLVFKKDSAFVLTKTVSPGATSVLFMKGTLTAKTAVDLEDVSLTFTSSTGANLIAKRYTLKIGTSTFTWTAGSWVAGSAAFDGAVSFGGTVPVELYADIDVNAPASNITFGSLNLNSFVTTKEYQNTQNTIASSIGSINSASVYVESTKLSVSKTDGLASLVTLVKDTQDEKLVYGVTLSNNQTNAINVSNLVVNNTSAWFNSGMSLTLYVNDVPTSTKTVSASMVTFNSMNVNVVNGTPVNLKVKATINGVATGTQGQFYISSIDATDTVSSSAALFSGLPATGSMVRVVDAWSSTVTLNSATPAATLLYGGMSSTEVGTFDVEARNDSMKLTDLYVSATTWFDVGKFATILLTDDTTTYPGIKDGNTIKFESMNLAIAANVTKTFKIKVALSNVELTGDLATPSFAFTINTGYSLAKAGTTNGLRLTSDSNGLPVTNVTTPSVISNTHTVVAGYPFLSSPTTDNTTVMQFTVTPKGTKVRMASLTFTSAWSAFTGNVELRDNNNNFISSGTVAGGTLTFTGNSSIVTNATTFRVVSPTYSASQNDSRRSFTITDLSYDQWTSADGIYTNVSTVSLFKNAVGLSSPSSATFSTLY